MSGLGRNNLIDRSPSFSDSPDDSDESIQESWVEWWTHLKGNDFLCEVSEEFLRDEFNLYGFAAQVPFYPYAMSIILDDDPDINDQELDAQQQDLAESAAEILYGLVHSRFIITNRGLELMAEKFRQVRFGTCPRMQCNRQPLLPIGQSDNPQQSNVRLYCGKCNDIFCTEPKSCSLDGAYFGTTFPHMFFMQYPDLKPERIDGNGKLYVPRIFGFRVHDPTETDDERALRRSLYVPPPQAQDDSGSN